MITNGNQTNWPTPVKGSSLMAVMKSTASKTVVLSTIPPSLQLLLDLPFLESRGEMPMCVVQHVVIIRLKEDSFQLDRILQDLEL
jgi:hypothetical protein